MDLVEVIHNLLSTSACIYDVFINVHMDEFFYRIYMCIIYMNAFIVQLNMIC